VVPEKDQCLYRWSYLCEVRAYRRLTAAACPHVPHFYSASKGVELVYPQNCVIRHKYRLKGKHPAILLEFIEGEMLTKENFRPELQPKVLDTFGALLDLEVIHGDATDSCHVRNAIVTRDDEIVWIHFERAKIPELRWEDNPFTWEEELKEGE
jgi:hypothetical protein